MRSAWFWAVTILGSGLSLAVFWLTDIPLGVRGEWTWGRHDVTPDLVANALMCLAVGAAYLTSVALGYRRLARTECTRLEAAGWLIGLGLMAAGWIGTVQGTGSTGATVGRWPFVLYYPSSSGYFSKSRYEAPAARHLLRDYETLMREGDVLHIGTHPPGLFLFFRGLIGLVEAFPQGARLLNALQPAAVREAFDVIRSNSASTNFSPLTEQDQAVIWLAGLICFGLSAAVVWPLYGFLRDFGDRPSSWACAAVWPLVPAVAVFLPKSDVAFACLSMTLGWLWLRAWRAQSSWRAGLAGGLWTAGVLCSLAFLPVALWLALLSLFDSWPALRRGAGRAELTRALRTILPAGIVCVSLLAALAWWGEIPLWKTYWLNYRNHAGFYAQYPRDYLSWLAVNPMELACALGVPVFVAVVGSWAACFRRGVFAERTSLVSVCLATLIVWGWLWISGKNSGEAARLWIFLMPFCVASAAAVWLPETPAASSRRIPWALVAWLACQLLVCFGTVQRINGFSLG